MQYDVEKWCKRNAGKRKIEFYINFGETVILGKSVTSKILFGVLVQCRLCRVGIFEFVAKKT